jgi:rhodanese-related sulfurtransferase
VNWLPDLRVSGAAALLLAAAGLAWHGQPGVEQKWEWLASKYEPRLIEREVYIDPAELLQLMNDDYIDLQIFDVRNESDWNQFHLADSERIPLDALPAQRERLRALPENAVLVVVSNDEILATEAWKRLMVIARPNVYILEGGLNLWLNLYAVSEDEIAGHGQRSLAQPDGRLRHQFKRALGARHAAARPDQHLTPQREYTPKVRLLKKIAKAGGCG